jgi:large subunit ribosomal protein L10
MPSQQVLEQKSDQVEAIKEILCEYKSIGIASLQKVRAAQLQELKKTLTGKVYMRVLKNTLIKLALEEMSKAELKPLEQYLEGSNLFLFTDLNPFKLAILLEKGKVKTTAKSGDTAAMDVIIPAGNTTTRPNNQPAKRCRLAHKNRVWQRMGKQRHAGSPQRRNHQRTTRSRTV